MEEILPRLILVEQDGFCQGRQIVDGIIIMHETIYFIKLKKEAKMLIKLGMQKTYDRVSWQFFYRVLERFGFNKQWRKWINLCT